MPYKIQDSMLVAYEEVSAETPDPLPTIYARLIAGWNCPDCGALVRALTGPWNDPHAQWWAYDHRPGHASSNRDVRPVSPKFMTRYIGSYNAAGGYLRQFSHMKPLERHFYDTSPRSSKCTLGISQRVGIRGGVAAFPRISDYAYERLAYVLESGGQFKHVQLIPEITGAREPIIATDNEAGFIYQSAMHHAYRQEEYLKAWDTEIVEKLLEPKSAASK